MNFFTVRRIALFTLELVLRLLLWPFGTYGIDRCCWVLSRRALPAFAVAAIPAVLFGWTLGVWLLIGAAAICWFASLALLVEVERRQRQRPCLSPIRTCKNGEPWDEPCGGCKVCQNNAARQPIEKDGIRWYIG